MKRRINKKSVVEFITVKVVIIILSAIVLTSIIIPLTKNMVAESDDLACRALIQVKDSKPGKVVDFFSELNAKCLVDEKVKLDVSEEEETYETIAKNSARCWYRYGEGEYDFFFFFNTNDDWCFLCA